jgi:hypothetical protein
LDFVKKVVNVKGEIKRKIGEISMVSFVPNNEVFGKRAKRDIGESRG